VVRTPRGKKPLSGCHCRWDEKQNLKKQEGNAWTDHLDHEVSRSDRYTKAKIRSPISGDKGGIQGFLACVY